MCNSPLYFLLTAKMLKRISFQILINPRRRRPNMALDVLGAIIWVLPKRLEKEGNLPPIPFVHPDESKNSENIFYRCAAPSFLWTRCPDWNHGSDGNMWSSIPPTLTILETSLCACGRPPCACVGLSPAANGCERPEYPELGNWSGSIKTMVFLLTWFSSK